MRSYLALLCCLVACNGDGNAPNVSSPPALFRAPVPKNSPPKDQATSGDISGTITTTPANAIKGGAVVYFEDAPKEAGKGATATIDNRQMSFSPYITVLTVGGTVKFNNADPFPHNVFSPQPNGWDIGVINQNSVKTRVFDKTGFYALLCNLHPNMIGFLAVVPSSYFAKTDSKGKYVIKGVPTGTYKISAWAPRLKLTTQSVVVNGDTTVDMIVLR